MTPDRSIHLSALPRVPRLPHPPRLGLEALLLILVATTVACTMPGHSPSSESASTALPDGINDVFLSEDLDVDKFVERFEGESRAVYAQRNAIVDALNLTAGDSVADIGAGTGFFSMLFAEKVAETGSVYAVEISPKFLDHLSTLAREKAPGILRPTEGTETSVELPDASIDLAFICDVYHHFAYPTQSLQSLHSAIRPGGSLVLIDFKRIPGESPEWLLEHVRAGRDVFQAEIEAAGFALAEQIEIKGLEDNYYLRFQRIE